MEDRAFSENQVFERRFSNYRILEHLVLIVLFFLLVTTGLAQKFHLLGISQSVILALGGIDSTRYATPPTGSR